MEIKLVGGPRDGEVIFRHSLPKMLGCMDTNKENPMYGLYLSEEPNKLVWTDLVPPPHLAKAHR